MILVGLLQTVETLLRGRSSRSIKKALTFSPDFGKIELRT